MSVLMIGLSVSAQTADNASAFFEQKVETLLTTKCLECHGVKSEGGLDLRSRQPALEGGEHGTVLVPGDARKSKLYDLVYNEEMPPKNSLTDDEVDILKQWIDSGAHFPSEPLVGPGESDEWWSLMPLKSFETGGLNVDDFVDRMLDEKKLVANGPASPQIIVRRLYFDMHGMPPAPETVNDFLEACRKETGSSEFVGEKAYEKLIERVLDSPRYGERWARHWLDVAHFGETHGFDKDHRRNNAWLYRDYVVDAFNSDKPYTEFIRQQIAGDANPNLDPEGIIATGFLAAGPWDQVGHMEIREGTVEKKRVRNLDRDDMVTNVFNTFVSTTVQCARCHAHKFDPIPRDEYYSLQSVFSGLDRGERPYGDPTTARKRTRWTKELDQARKDREAIFNKNREGLPSEYEKLKSSMIAFREQRSSLESGEKGESPSNGYHSVVNEKKETHEWVQVDLGEPLSLDTIVLLPARPTDFEDTPGFGFPIRFSVTVSEQGEGDDFETIVDYKNSDFTNPGDKEVSFDANGRSIRRIRIDAYELWERNNDFVFALAELEAISEGENVARSKTVSASSTIEFGRWNLRFLVDGYDSRQPRESGEERVAERLQHVQKRIGKKRIEIDEMLREHKPLAQVNAEIELREKIATLEKQLGELPVQDKMYGVNPRSTRPVFDLTRGNVAAPVEQVVPSSLSMVKALESTLIHDSEDESAARLALSDWLADKDNVLTWRSIANRIWQYHFGTGLVGTPNDFGRAGTLPTHPELLDWLAEQMKEKDSIKDLHRVILASEAYRRSSEFNEQNAEIDGSNQYLWRMNRRKLDAESIYDSILAVSGKLDLTMGGPSFELFNYTHDHSPRYDFLGKDSPDVWRRSVYRFLVRSVPDPLFEVLDCADPNLNTPVRNQTLTAPQALAMLNDPFMVYQSKHTAARLKEKHETPGGQIEDLYLRAFSRPPSTEEKSSLIKYAQANGLENLARLVFNLNEFMFVD